YALPPPTRHNRPHRHIIPVGSREIMPACPGGCARPSVRGIEQRSSSRETTIVTSNLTRDEAAERARLLRVDSYQVELDLTGGDTTLASVTTVRFRCLQPGESTFIELPAPEVSQVALNGRLLPAAAFDGNRIALDDLAESNELEVKATCAYSRSGEGLHRF